MLFRGREVTHSEVGKEIMLRMADSLEVGAVKRGEGSGEARRGGWGEAWGGEWGGEAMGRAAD